MVSFGVGRARRRTVGRPSRVRVGLAVSEERSRRARAQPAQQRVTKVQSNTAKVLDDLDHEQQSCGAQGCDGKADANGNQHEYSRTRMTPATRVRVGCGGPAPGGAGQEREITAKTSRLHTAGIQVGGARTRLRDGAENLQSRHG